MVERMSFRLEKPEWRRFFFSELLELIHIFQLVNAELTDTEAGPISCLVNGLWNIFEKMDIDAAAAAKSPQSCPTLCNPIVGSRPGSPIPGILQARTLEWVAISFFIARKWKVKVQLLSHVRLLVTPWTAAYQTPPPMGFSRQEYWSGVPLPSLDIDDPGKKHSFLPVESAPKSGGYWPQSTFTLWLCRLKFPSNVWTKANQMVDGKNFSL